MNRAWQERQISIAVAAATLKRKRPDTSKKWICDTQAREHLSVLHVLACNYIAPVLQCGGQDRCVIDVEVVGAG